MARNKKSLFEWLTGSSNADYDTSFEDLDHEPYPHSALPEKTLPVKRGAVNQTLDTTSISAPEPEGELSIDMYQTPTHIIIKAMIAGVRPEDLDVSITRDMVTLRGKRERHTEGGSDDFMFQELYWGAFSRTISLPQEIDMDGAEANEKHGLLIIRLPKVDKGKQTKVRVKAS